MLIRERQYIIKNDIIMPTETAFRALTTLILI